jgi:hypothetical protein
MQQAAEGRGVTRLLDRGRTGIVRPRVQVFSSIRFQARHAIHALACAGQEIQDMKSRTCLDLDLPARSFPRAESRPMIASLSLILLCQLTGEVIVRGLSLPMH